MNGIPEYGVYRPTSTPTEPEYVAEATTRPEPAADAIERAAKALADHAAVEGENWYVDDDGTEHFPKWDDLPDEESYLGGDQEWPNPGRNHFRAKARAALQAAAVEPEPGLSLDELLAPVSEGNVILEIIKGVGPEHEAYLDFTPGENRRTVRASGFGEGFAEAMAKAVANAVRRAKENGDG